MLVHKKLQKAAGSNFFLYKFFGKGNRFSSI